EVTAWKRANPADDLLSALIAAEEDGDVLSEEELIAQVTLLYIAGHETTVNLIGTGALSLLRHRAQPERLRSHPSLVPDAGAALARLEAQVALGQLVQRFPGLELRTDEQSWNGRIVLRGLDRLPVALGA